MLTIADGGVQELLILADIICEQPLKGFPRFPIVSVGTCLVRAGQVAARARRY